MPTLNASFNTLIDVLSLRAAEQPGQMAYTVLMENGETCQITYSELEAKTRILAGILRARGATGQRVLLLQPPGLEFMVAFFACLYAGAVAVPAYPPRHHRAHADHNLTRLRAIITDAEPLFAITTPAVLSRIDQLSEYVPEFGHIHWLTNDAESIGAEETAWRKPEVSGNTLAFLQYTSGSTSIPKGVMVSHGNLLRNMEDLDRGWEHDEHSVMVTWLPTFHDMGLIYGVLVPLYKGFPCYILAPQSFLQQPLRWLQAISRYRGTHSAAPNFAYDLCVRKIPPAQRAGLDLSHWRVTLNGAEPVRKETMEQFTEAFGPYGFKASTFCPGYGLAEATLKVSAADPADATAHVMVGCGDSRIDTRIFIVHPETGTTCAGDEIGEIWVAGETVAQGYWNRPEETAQTFRAHLAGGEGPFLRTGDLGFLHGGELFVTGRLKDVIIIRGSNHYPQDIEFTVGNGHPALLKGCGAAFAVDVEGEERLVVVQEVARTHRRNLDTKEVFAAIRSAVAQHHALEVYETVLIMTGTTPRTSSGKIQRRTCKALYLANDLDVIAASRGSHEPVPPVEAKRGPNHHGRETADIEQWLKAKIARDKHLLLEDIDAQQPFHYYGLGSLDLVNLVSDLETYVGGSLSPTLVFDYPTIESLAQHLGVAAPAEASRSAEPAAVPAVEEDSDLATAIAIIGMACRFPKADTPEAYWELLSAGKSAISEVPADRWNIDDYYDPNPDRRGKMATRWGGFLDRVDTFDPLFFGIAPREAASIDPQQRLLLEVVWEALENAGQVPEALAGTNTGVFIGISGWDYGISHFQNPQRLNSYSGTGTAHSIAANRISYFLDLRGPSVAVDTACSSSAAALHLACQSLRGRETGLAIAGGVNLMLAPELSIALSQANMMASDGQCKTFDAKADGYVRGEGCGIVLLKRLPDALEAGDNILALIRGSSINQDGRSNGLTAPNGIAQQEVIRQALQSANLPAEAISYIETHGTGTSLGDPIEVGALSAVLGGGRKGTPCFLGSVKSNIGHLEAAAGIASVIKVVLALRHGLIPPQINFDTLNPDIDLQAGPFRIPAGLQEWKATADRRRGGVSSFGFGGTNVHLVLEEAPPGPARKNPPESGDSQVLFLSAKTETALAALARRHVEHFAANPGLSLADVCRTANLGRAAFGQRLAVTGRSLAELSERLGAAPRGEEGAGIWRGVVRHEAKPRVAFLFPGQGSQYPRMGEALYRRQPAFRDAVDRCAALLADRLDTPLAELLYAAPADLAAHDPLHAQLLLFVTEYALLELWRFLGVKPHAVMGHSTGEYVAAVAAGILELDAALDLVHERGRLLRDIRGDGAMAAVAADEEELARLIDLAAEEVSVAALNSPRNTVLAGRRERLDRVLETLRGRGVAFRRMDLAQAYHSHLLDPVLDAFEAAAARHAYDKAAIPLVSCLTGEVAGVRQNLDARHWRNHLRQPVRFRRGMTTLAGLGCDLFLEVGPGQTLAGFGKQCLGARKSVWIPSLRPGGEWDTIMEALAALFVHGEKPALAAWYRQQGAELVGLPNYPFERERYWFESRLPAVPAPQPESRPRAASPDESALNLASTAFLELLNKQAEALSAQAEVLRLQTERLLPGALAPVPPARLVEIPCSRTPDRAAIEMAVLQAISEVSAFPVQTLRKEYTLMGDLGFDSLMLVKLHQELPRRFPGLAIETPALFANASIEALIALIVRDSAGPAEIPEAARLPLPKPPAGASAAEPVPPMAASAPVRDAAITAKHRFYETPRYREFQDRLALIDASIGMRPYFKVVGGVNRSGVAINDRECVNYSSYNYLGMSGDPKVSAAAKEAIDRYGTSVSASRILSGEIPLHKELEKTIADFLGVEDAIVYVSGHATNVTTIGHLVGEGDLILNDALCHNSIIQGCLLSGARRISFKHNDMDDLERLLATLGHLYNQILITVEGVYSMDGDIADLPRLLELKQRYGALLLVDEAHSLGVLGKRGGGVCEYYGIPGGEVDLLMGTLSKSLASCGGYIAGSRKLIEYLKYTAPGFIFSVGIPPSNAAASMTALKVLRDEPERVERLHQSARLFLSLAKSHGMNVGPSVDSPVIPIIVGDSGRCLRLSERLYGRGINVEPIIYPAVDRDAARLRFFITSEHTHEQIRYTVQCLAEELAGLDETTLPEPAAIE